MNLLELLEKTLPGLGYELADLEVGGMGLVRVFIDKQPGGITVEDCVTVSNHLTRLFEVEGIDFDRLEVSSPGLDRPLKKESDFVRFVGHEAKVKLRLPIEGRKVFVGVILGVVDGVVNLQVESTTVGLGLSQIDKARLVPKF
ncbi:ribosome maturation factor RimP [Parachitinimonas caeni]|uniref:Ribosome maturation factor RimP n=1 Tax=Parachitinimonas caeni TaxID=3031301 RepID=A0ABT7DZG0_9NEIS|nr:ribosome maturation factor RimP [Parachitinimonas caeni]MDK2125384.1 ribosome maturation factor RimP [Parachitinimonas caeni]